MLRTWLCQTAEFSAGHQTAEVLDPTTLHGPLCLGSGVNGIIFCQTREYHESSSQLTVVSSMQAALLLHAHVSDGYASSNESETQTDITEIDRWPDMLQSTFLKS